MPRTIEFLMIPENRQTAILHLAHPTNNPNVKDIEDMDRLVLVTGGTVFVETHEGRIFIGPGCTSNAVRVAAGVRASFLPAMAENPTLHTIVGTRHIDSALAYTEITSFNGGSHGHRSPVVT